MCFSFFSPAKSLGVGVGKCTNCFPKRVNLKSSSLLIKRNTAQPHRLSHSLFCNGISAFNPCDSAQGWLTCADCCSHLVHIIVQ